MIDAAKLVFKQLPKREIAELIPSANNYLSAKGEHTILNWSKQVLFVVLDCVMLVF